MSIRKGHVFLSYMSTRDKAVKLALPVRAFAASAGLALAGVLLGPAPAPAPTAAPFLNLSLGDLFFVAGVVLGFAAAIWSVLVKTVLAPPPRHDPAKLPSGGYELKNWAGQVSFAPKELADPDNLDELVQCVTKYGQAGRKMHAVGAMHSWSTCMASDDVTIMTGRLNRILNVDKDRKTVTAEAGTCLKDIYAYIDQCGMAFPTLPNVDIIHVGGAISNAAHGTNLQHGTFSSLVTEMQIVVFRGGKDAASSKAEVITLKKDDDDESNQRWFNAAVTSFGSLGIIYTVTLKCVDAYCSFVSERAVDFDKEVQGRVASICNAYPSVQIAVLPSKGVASLKVQVPISTKAVQATATSLFSNWDILQAKIFFFALQPNATSFLWLRAIFSGLLNLLPLTASGALSRKRAAVMSWTDAELASRLQAALSSTPWTNMEDALPIEQADIAARLLADLLRKHGKAALFSMRAVGADQNGYLSPTYGRPSVFFDVPMSAAVDKSVYLEVEKLLLSLGGRSSWSRVAQSPLTPESVAKQYPKVGEFVRAKKEMDPFSAFSNAFSDSVLGKSK